jgi:hypothetical protein
LVDRSLTRFSGGRCGGIITTPRWIEFTFFDKFIVANTAGEVESDGGLGFDVVGLFESDVDKFVTVRKILMCARDRDVTSEWGGKGDTINDE